MRPSGCTARWRRSTRPAWRSARPRTHLPPPRVRRPSTGPDGCGEKAVRRFGIAIESATVVGGVEVFAQTFRTLDPGARVEVRVPDGARVQPGDVVVSLEGRAAAILSAERTALNLLQRMSGVATATAACVAAVEGYPVRIIDTRKTAPGLRLLDKYAVRVGGGSNHRYNLADAVLIKDNHLEVARSQGLDLTAAIAHVRQ